LVAYEISDYTGILGNKARYPKIGLHAYLSMCPMQLIICKYLPDQDFFPTAKNCQERPKNHQECVS